MKATTSTTNTLQPYRLLTLPLLVGMLFVFSTLAIAGGYGNSMKGHGKSMKNDIVQTATDAGNFGTLLTAVQAAGLEDTLKGDGPFTLFAPTDEAFAQIPADQLNALLQDKAALTKVLTYHVVAGKVMARDVVKLDSARTVEGQSIAISTMDGVKVNDANVIKTDIMASNGVIHVIDKVIIPN